MKKQRMPQKSFEKTRKIFNDLIIALICTGSLGFYAVRVKLCRGAFSSAPINKSKKQLCRSNKTNPARRSAEMRFGGRG